MAYTVTNRAASRGIARPTAGAGRRTRDQLLASTAIRLALQASVLAGLACAATVPASANPTGGVVTAGSAKIGPSASDPNTLTITQTTDRAAINWQSFSINSNETTQFIQPSTSSTALNRVVGSDPSVIAGHLEANGNLILINPNGVAFAKGSQVNVNSLVATPANLTDADFMAGRTNFSSPSANANASVTNDGTITVGKLGIAALVGPKVRNSGVINATLGHVVLGGAETFTVDLYGDGLLSFDVGTKAHSPLSVVNDGQINAQGGTVQISAETADALVSSVVNMGGQVNAQGGTVTADAGATGKLDVTGTVDVSNRAAGQTGGAVSLTGQDVEIEAGALIDASGAAGGGSIKVGGGLHGTDATVRNAATTTIDAGATLDASAIDKGNGGKIAVWSDQQTKFAGTIKATGGAKGGDGGFAEVSSKGVLGFTGLVDLTAPLGKMGTLLLDPTELDIVAPGADTITCTQGICNADATPSLLTNTTLDGLLNNATVNLAADTIDFKASVVGTGTLNADATTAIIMDPGVSIKNTVGGELNIGLRSGNIESTVLGNITFGANSSIATGGGELAIIATGQMTFDPTTLISSAGPATDGFISLGAQSLTLPNTINAGGAGLQLTATAGGIAQTGGSITAGFIRGSAVGDVTLTQATNNIEQVAGFTTGGGNFSLTSAAPTLLVTDTIDAGTGKIALDATNDLQLGQDGIGATFNATGGTSLTASGAIAMAGPVTTNGPTTVVAGTRFDDGDFTFSTTNNTLSLTTPVLVLQAVAGLNSGTAATTISAPANEGMSVGDTSPVAGTLNVTNTDLNQIISGGLTLTTASGQDITVNGARSSSNNGPITLQSGGKLSFPGDFTSPTDVNLVAATTITETGGAISAPVITGSAGGDVTLNNARNSISFLTNFIVTGGDFSLLDTSTSLTIGSLATATPTLDVSGNITIAESLTGGALILGRVGGTGTPSLAFVGPTGPALVADLRSGGSILLETGNATNGSVAVEGPTTMNANTTIGVAGPQFVVANTLSTGTNLLAVATPSSISVGTAAAGTLNIADASLANITAGSLDIITPGTINLDSVTAHAAIGLVNLSGNAGITFAPVPNSGVTGGSTVFANGLSAITSAGDITLNEDVSTGPSLFLAALAGNITQQSGGITATTVAAQASGNINLSDSTNSIGTIGMTIGNTLVGLQSTGGFIDVTTNAVNQPLTIAGPVTTGGDEVFIEAGGAMTVASTVSAAAGHTVLFSGGDLTIAANATVSSPTSTVDIGAQGALEIDGAVAAPTGNVGLNAKNGITEGATGSIVGASLSGIATGNVSLNSPDNQIGLIDGFLVTAGNFSLVDATNLTIADSGNSDGATFALSAPDGNIGVQVNGGNLTLGNAAPPNPFVSGKATLTASTTGTITLGATGDIDVVGATTGNTATGMTAGGNIGLANNLGVTGDLSLVATAGGINQTSGALNVTGTLLGSSGTDTNLNTATNIIPTLGLFTAGGSLSLADEVALSVAGNVTAGTQITLNATGEGAGITQDVGLITAPTLDLITNGDVLQNAGGLHVGTLLAQVGGNITIDAGANAIGTIGAVTAGGGIDIGSNVADQLLSVTGPVTSGGGNIILANAGPMTVTGAIAENGAGGAINLSTGSGTLALNGSATAGGEVALNSGADIQINGAVDSSTGISLTSVAGMTEGAGGSLSAPLLQGSAGGDVALTAGENTIALLDNFKVTGGNFAFADSTDLTIADTTIVTQSVVIVPAIDAGTGSVNVQVNGGTLTLGAPAQGVEIPAATATIIGTGGITLGASGDTNVAGPTTTTGATSLTGANIGLGDDLSVTGDLRLVASAGTIGQTNGALTVSGALTGSSVGATTLTSTANSLPTLGNFTSGGALTLVDNVPLTITGAVDATSEAGSIFLTTNGGNSLTVAATGSLTGAGPFLQLNSGGPIEIDGAIASTGTVELLSPSTITEGPAGSIAAAELTGTAGGDVALNGTGNTIALLDGFTITQTGNFSLLNSSDLTIADRAIDGPSVIASAIDVGAGTINVQVTGGSLTFGRTAAAAAQLDEPTTATLLGTGGVTLAASGNVNVVGVTTANAATGITAGGAINLADSLGITGDLQLTATAGAIAQTGGILTTTGMLSGSSGGDTSLTTVGNLVPTLGAFTAGGALTLADNIPLTVTGPVQAGGDITLSSVAQMTVDGGSFATPGNILFQVSAVEGPAQFTQTGTTTFDPNMITIDVTNSSSPGTVSLENFMAPGADLVLRLGNGKATASNLAVGGLDVIGSGGSASLFGTVAGVGGPPAARLAFQSNVPFDPAYQLNNCTIELGCLPPNSIFNPDDPVASFLAALEAAAAHNGVVYVSTGRQKKPYTDPTIDTLNIGSEDLF